MEERRVDPADGCAYTRQEFVTCYGGDAEWERGVPLPAAETRVDPADGRRYTRQEFVQCYGGSDEWDGARQDAGETAADTARGLERAEPATLRPYQRRQYLSRAFPSVSSYVLNCCANDSHLLSLRDSAERMREVWLPLADELMEERRLLVARLSTDPPRLYSVPDAPKPAQKKAKKGRLQGAGAGVVRKQAPAAGPGWTPTGDRAACAVSQQVSDGSVQVIRPGMLLFKRAIPVDVQQHFADVSIALGTPTNGRSGGWYYVDGAGKKHWNNPAQAGEPGVGFGQMSEPIASFPSQYRSLCEHYLSKAREADKTLPAMKPSLALLNFYPPEQPGIYWHRDNSAQEQASARAGSPVVSVSIGSAAVFAWRMESREEAREVVLESGDVLIFGGPSRLIHHAVPKVYGGAIPKGLTMPPGRINLTFRQVDAVV